MQLPVNDDDLLRACLQRMGCIVTQLSSPDHLPLHIINECRLFLNVESASLALYDEARGVLAFCASSGGESERLLESSLPLGEGIVGTVAQTRNGLMVNDVKLDPRWFRQMDQLTGFDSRHLMAAPIIYAGKLQGVIEVMNPRASVRFAESDLHQLQIFADLLAPILEAQRLVRIKMASERLAGLALAVTDLGHSIKNLIQHIEAPVAMMDDAIMQADVQRMATLWPIMRRASISLGTMARQMLDFVRPRQLQLAWHDLGALLEEVQQECLTEAQVLGIDLCLLCSADRYNAWVDGGVLRQALHNLIGNALEAIEENGGSRIELALSRSLDATEYQIAVTDDGPGIPTELQARIFEPFYSTKGMRGTGLGLAGVRKAAEDHGGQIQLVPNVSRGARFLLTLPCVTTG